MENNGEKSVGPFLADGAPDRLKLCFKLAALEENWEKAVGRQAAAHSQLKSCELSQDGLHIMINVEDAVALNSLRFKKAKFELAAAKFLGVGKVSVDFQIGRIVQKSAAKPARKPYERRAPVVLSGGEVEREIEEISVENGDREIEEALARVKAAAGRLRGREKR